MREDGQMPSEHSAAEERQRRQEEVFQDTHPVVPGMQKLLPRMAGAIYSTWLGVPGTNQTSVVLPLGQYANVVRIGDQLVAITTDGVGSKALLARQLGVYNTIGIDCVAMNVNDLVCVGAVPTAMVDYLAVEDAGDVEMVGELVDGLVEGALEAGVALVGGEVAEVGRMRGLDVSGTAIGYVPDDRIRVGKDVVQGDVILGLHSSGLHANGYTVARSALSNFGLLKQHCDELGCTMGEELLRPTVIYSHVVRDLMHSVPGVKACAHITGGGLWNLARLQAPVRYVIDSPPEPQPIFQLIQKTGGLSDEEMYRTFNMGVGMCVILAKDAPLREAMYVIGKYGRSSSIIGQVGASISGRAEVEVHVRRVLR